jgi:hypothetical protein
VEIFLLGWRACEKRRMSLEVLSPLGSFDHARLAEPSETEIKQMIDVATPKPKGPPYDQAEMKEYPIG